MTSRMKESVSVGLYAAIAAFLFSTSASWADMRFIQIEAKSKEQRSAIADLGVSIEATRSDSVWGFANENSLKRLSEKGFKVLGNFDKEIGRGGHEGSLDFPAKDARFHNYQEVTDTLKLMQSKNADITKMISIGKSTEGKEMWALHINTSPEALASGQSAKPGAIFMGNHHAREHLSVEIPLMWAQYLLDNRRDPGVGALLESRDIWVLPMINPDGAEFDVATGNYKFWRKNRRNNKDGTFGVDLNRNYGFKWGTGGSDKDTDSDVYMGPAPFSEPETKNVKAFVESHLNAKVLLTFHTFSELILYPWGHSYDPVGNAKDHQVFDKMAKTMAQWNHYTPEQASSLYIASGDTTDWAYGEHGIFAFTFELSPRDMFGGGFYPGAAVIDKVFADNIKPCTYLLQVADDPYKVINGKSNQWLKSYAEPGLSEELMMATHPIE